MKDAHDLYSNLLGINRDAFAVHFFDVAYYCLEKSAYLALELGDKAKLDEIEQLVVQQLGEIKNRVLGQNLLKEPPELVLYQSLARLVTTHRILLSNS